jgi:4-amino-4-deoxy-L-arabinose transferase-like glycosyltransferase
MMTDVTAQHASPQSRGNESRILLIGLAAVLTVYAVGLSRDVNARWGGMHDWNGAYYSQLARNLLRYPASIHYGMPIVAVGQAVPPVEERSIYATHPPGLIWLVAGAFWIGGESEATARCVAIIASLGALLAFISITRARRGVETALLAGIIYSLMPMTVFFGRMVDQEAICAALMLGAVASWGNVKASRTPGRWLAAWSVCVVSCVWVDWVGCLFGVLFTGYALLALRRREITTRVFVFMASAVVVAVISMVAYLVMAGLDGRWSDLWAIFTSRQEPAGRGGPGTVWRHVVENVTWPVLGMFILGIGIEVADALRGGQRKSSEGSGLGVMTITGTFWVILFWRQFEVHNYWMFYLGPAMAASAAHGLMGLAGDLKLRAPNLTKPALALLVIVTSLACLGRTNDYFSRESYSTESIRAWREIDSRTEPDAKIAYFRDPTLEERHGSYVFRNLIPPQMSYYVDRSFVVATDAQAVRAAAKVCSMFVIPFDDAQSHSEMMIELSRQYPGQVVGPLMLVDLRGSGSQPGS